jgi:ATP-dependent Lon protease
MDYSAIKQLEREVIFVLKEEYSFYQSLYVSLDRQRDSARFHKDGNLLDLFSEIRRLHDRISQSDEKIANLKDRDQAAFKMVVVLPDVKKLVNSIQTLVQKNMRLVAETEEYLMGRYDRIKSELGELQNSQKILKYFSQTNPSPQFVDGKK